MTKTFSSFLMLKLKWSNLPSFAFFMATSNGLARKFLRISDSGTFTDSIRLARSSSDLHFEQSRLSTKLYSSLFSSFGFFVSLNSL